MLAFCPTYPGILSMSRTETSSGLPAISVWVSEGRQSRGLTQEQVADAAGVDTTYISKIELGKKTPSEKVVNRIADAFTPEGASESARLKILNEGRHARGLLPVAGDGICGGEYSTFTHASGIKIKAVIGGPLNQEDLDLIAKTVSSMADGMLAGKELKIEPEVKS